MNVYDVMDRAIAEGVYEVQEKEGWVSGGIDHDPAEALWRQMGKNRYGGTKNILVMADGGGSCSRLWKAAFPGLVL